MSNKRRDIDFLRDIREAIENILTYTKGLDFDGFMRDKKTQDAVVHNLEIMGEAAKNLSPAIKERHPDIPWRKLAGVRDKIAHHYFGINYDIVWQIKEDLAGLLQKIDEIISSVPT
jgi:uncharacterized protein with HEPN domain